MKQNYIDGKGNYHNEQNLTLAQIYDSGVEFGCKVTAKDKAEDIIEELEKIREKFREELQGSMKDSLDYTIGIAKGIEIIDKHISELKGENKQ